MSSLPPFVLFFAAAPLLAFTRGWTRKGVLLLVPVAGGLALLGAPEGQVLTLSLLGYELTPYRVDRLSLLFGYLFHLAFFIGALFALHVQDRTQHVAAMLYAGSALGAVFAGDLMTLFVFWELAALSSVFLVWARRNPQALGAGWRYLVIQIVSGLLLLAGVLLKMGTYGFIRLSLPILPDASVHFAPMIAVLSIIGILYAALICWVQSDVKKLVAYSSVSHLGFCVLGLFSLNPLGVQGSVLYMLNHGLSTGALFLLIGMIYERRHTRMISEYGGLGKVMPIYAGVFLFMAFASVGLPGLSGFVGEFGVLLGSYLTLPVLAIIAGFGVILAAVYMLWAYERVFTGPVTNPKNEGLSDLGFREIAILVPLVAIVIGIGVYPEPVFERVDPSVEIILDRVEAATDYEIPEYGRFDEVVEPSDVHREAAVDETGEDEHGDEEGSE